MNNKDESADHSMSTSPNNPWVKVCKSVKSSATSWELGIDIVSLFALVFHSWLNSLPEEKAAERKMELNNEDLPPQSVVAAVWQLLAESVGEHERVQKLPVHSGSGLLPNTRVVV